MNYCRFQLCNLNSSVIKFGDYILVHSFDYMPDRNQGIIVSFWRMALVTGDRNSDREGHHGTGGDILVRLEWSGLRTKSATQNTNTEWKHSIDKNKDQTEDITSKSHTKTWFHNTLLQHFIIPLQNATKVWWLWIELSVPIFHFSPPTFCYVRVFVLALLSWWH